MPCNENLPNIFGIYGEFSKNVVTKCVFQDMFSLSSDNFQVFKNFLRIFGILLCRFSLDIVCGVFSFLTKYFSEHSNQ